jgi:hypothetical protein
MVSKKIQDLSTADLTFLEEILHKELIKESNEKSTWRAAHSYEKNDGGKGQKLSRCIDAVRSQKRVRVLTTREKW